MNILTYIMSVLTFKTAIIISICMYVCVDCISLPFFYIHFINEQYILKWLSFATELVFMEKRLTWQVSLVEQELLTLPKHQISSPDFSGVCVTRSLLLYVWFVDRCLYFFFWPLCCLFFFDIRNLITPLVSSNFSFLVTWLSSD